MLCYILTLAASVSAALALVKKKKEKKAHFAIVMLFWVFGCEKIFSNSQIST